MKTLRMSGTRLEMSLFAWQMLFPVFLYHLYLTMHFSLQQSLTYISVQCLSRQSNTLFEQYIIASLCFVQWRVRRGKTIREVEDMRPKRSRHRSVRHDSVSQLKHFDSGLDAFPVMYIRGLELHRSLHFVMAWSWILSRYREVNFDMSLFLMQGCWWHKLFLCIHNATILLN